MTGIMKYPKLDKIYKGRFPFKIGTTSFIYPDHRLPNAICLAPYVDEIELLYFESRFPDSLPARSEIQGLKSVQEQESVGYNIHLPVDIDIGGTRRPARQTAIDTIQRFYEKTVALTPTTFTLHLPCTVHGNDLPLWTTQARDGLRMLVDNGIPPMRISLETLLYPVEWLIAAEKGLNYRFCLDLGHMIISGQDISRFFDTQQRAVDMIHLHGVADGEDHHGLDMADQAQAALFIDVLSRYAGTVSLELFSFTRLQNSLQSLCSWFPI